MSVNCSNLCIILLSISKLILIVTLFYLPLSLYYPDINECDMDMDVCAGEEVAECTNTLGSFSCRCRDGYTGDGFTCAGTYAHSYHLHSVFG